MKHKWMDKFIIFAVLMLSMVFVHNTSAKELDKYFDNADEMMGVIAYIDFDGDIYLYYADKDEHIQLTEDAEWFHYKAVQFSPDANALSYLKSNPEKGMDVFDLYIMNLTTKEAIRVLENISDYDWHPDGDKIVFGYGVDDNCQAVDQESTNGINLLNMSNGQITELIPPESADFPVGSPQISNDGKWIKYDAYKCFSSGAFYQIVQNIDTEEIVYGSTGSIDWSPDGSQLIWAE